MTTFRYQAIEAAGSSVQGIIEAEDRRNALQQLKYRGLVPASLERSGDHAILGLDRLILPLDPF